MTMTNYDITLFEAKGDFYRVVVTTILTKFMVRRLPQMGGFCYTTLAVFGFILFF